MKKTDAYAQMFEYGEQHRPARKQQHKAAPRTKNGIRVLKRGFTLADAAHVTRVEGR